jgi:hypothetical protein
MSTRVTQRKLAGAIRRARRVFLYVVYNEAGSGVYVEVPKTLARTIVLHMSDGDVDRDDAATADVEEARGGVLYIG